MPIFRINAIPSPDLCTLTLAGEVDLDVAGDVIELGELSLADGERQTLVVDLAGVTFIDSTGLSALVSLQNTATSSGKQFQLANIPDRVQRLLTMTGLDAVFDVRT